MTTVVTGMHPAGRVEYGERFLQTFDRYWPSDIRLLCYVESGPFPAGRAELRSLWLCEGAEDFMARHKDSIERCGRLMAHKWKSKERVAGYSFRYDAVKFFKQILIPNHAAEDLPDGEILVWLDADVMTLRDIPDGFIEGLLGDYDLCYLGRGERHSEIGLWAVRLSAGTRQFLDRLAWTYTSDQVFKLAEHHSAFVFDHCRREFETCGGRTRDLTPGGNGHVFSKHPVISKYCDHLKGHRKALGRSPERR